MPRHAETDHVEPSDVSGRLVGDAPNWIHGAVRPTNLHEARCASRLRQSSGADAVVSQQLGTASRRWTVSEPVDDWGRVLGKMIARTEARVSIYQKLVQEAYKAGDREHIDLFKESQKDEEKFLKKLRREKTAWNESTPWTGV